MFKFALIELLAMWVVWFYPFLRHLLWGPKRESNVMAPRGTWGLVLQTAAC